MIKKLVRKLFNAVFSSPDPSYGQPLDEDLAFLEGLARPNDKRPDAGDVGAAAAVAMNVRRNDGTPYGADYPNCEKAHELARRASLVPPCTSGYPDAGEHCAGHFCGGSMHSAPQDDELCVESWRIINGPPAKA